MGSEQADSHIRRARDASSLENKMQHVCDALDALTYALREVESAVRTLKGSRSY